MIYDLDASTQNVMASLGWFLRGTYAAQNSQSAAFVKRDDNGAVVLRSWLDLFPTSPQIIVASVGQDVEADLDERLVQGSPVWVMQSVVTTGTPNEFGGSGYRLTGTVTLALICTVWAELESRRVDISATRLQLMAVRDAIQELCRYHMGGFPIWDATAGPVGENYGPNPEPLGWCRLTPMGQPIDRADLFRTDLSLRVEAQILGTQVS